MSKTHSVLLVGGPDAGKTNFLCRLALAILEKKGKLRENGLPGELEYLRSGVTKLLGGEFAPHTPTDVLHSSEMPVKYSEDQSNLRGKLIVPDCSGENWLNIFQKREWSDPWEKIVSELCGCLLFVRIDSNHIVTPLDWVSCEKLLGFPPTDFIPPENESGSIIPTQVIMVDWLQCLRNAFSDLVSGSFCPRIGLVVTAWDLAPKEQKASGPIDYVEQNFPLLWQFMQTNGDRFHFSTFGVSVVGGDLKAGGFRQAYLDGDPREAGYVLHSLDGHVEKSSDLTLPVAWAMGWL